MFLFHLSAYSLVPNVQPHLTDYVTVIRSGRYSKIEILSQIKRRKDKTIMIIRLDPSLEPMAIGKCCMLEDRN
jgi:hypothetical protein